MDAASATPTGCLPIPRTLIIGREDEIEAARTFLLDDAVPLLTLTGPGGVGKTRLALAIAGQVAASFADGVAWVDLAPLAEAALVPAAVARTCGISLPVDGSSEDGLIHGLRSRQALLLLDNCEHLLPAVGHLAASLLPSCAAIQVLATSRGPIGVRGEQVLPVPPLPVAAEGAASCEVVGRAAAVRLFAQKARAVDPGFAVTDGNAAAVAAVCRRLDGLPLAIELAAARSSVLDPATLLSLLDRQAPVLGAAPRDAPARQQTLEATVAWSYGLLTGEERRLFRRLAVFSGGFTLEAAAAVGALPVPGVAGLLEGLLNQSLLLRRTDAGAGVARYAMLETIRAFGLERLADSGDGNAARDCHAAYFRGLVASRDAAWAAYLPNAQQVLDELESEYPNLRAALAWLRASGDAAGVLDLAGSLFFFWQLQSHLGDGRAWLEWGLAHDADVAATTRAWGQLALSGILFSQGEYGPSLALGEESLRHFRAVGDLPGIARASDHAACVSLDADRGKTVGLINEALAACAACADAAWSERTAAHVHFYRGLLAFWHDDLEGAERVFRDVVARQDALALADGAEHPYTCWPLLNLGHIARIRGAAEDALRFYQGSVARAAKFREARCTMWALTGVAATLAAALRGEAASRLLGATEAFSDRAGLTSFVDCWSWQREIGLPAPWLSDDLPPNAQDRPGGAAIVCAWIEGRRLPIAVAVAEALAADLSGQAAPRAGDPRPPGPEAAAELTYREQEVLALLCRRLTDAEIAGHLFLSKRTVEHHVSAILGKLGVANRRQAAAFAARTRLI